MEIFSNAFSAGSIKRYRKRRRYQRLIKQKNTSVPAAAAWGWNMRAVKLKLRTKNIRVPPVKIMMTRLRNAYVRMMACFAGHLAQLNTGNGLLFNRIPEAPQLSYHICKRQVSKS